MQVKIFGGLIILMQWAEQLFREAKAEGIYCEIIKRSHGWPETMLLNRKTYFIKSMTYNPSRNLYFQGVDPKKLQEKGDYVLLCGGIGNKLKDIFMIPWEVFFHTLQKGEPINTYKPPKEYWQYKFYVKDRSGKWVITVQGGIRPEVDVSKYRYHSIEAIEKYLMVL